MSRCAFCGKQQRLGNHFFAHRLEQHSIQTVKVCEGCEPAALEAGFTVAEREPVSAQFQSLNSGTTAP